MLSGIQLPLCSVVFSLLLLIIYFSKKRIKTKETKIYSIMLILSLMDSILVSVLQMLGYDILSNRFIEVLNKIDFTILIIFGTCIFLYTFLITGIKNKTKLYNSSKISIIIADITAIIIMILSKIDIMRISESKMTVGGSAANVVYLMTFIYFGIFINN